MSQVSIYVNQFDAQVRERLELLRRIVLDEVPEAEEGKMYGLIGYKLNKKPLVYFGGFKRHIGFYATAQAHEQFGAELAQYKHGKGSVQFPLNQPLPINLIKNIVRYRKKNVLAVTKSNKNQSAI